MSLLCKVLVFCLPPFNPHYRTKNTVFKTYTRRRLPAHLDVFSWYFIWIFVSADRLGGDLKRETCFFFLFFFCVIAFPLCLKCTIKRGSRAARANKWLQRCHEKTHPSGLQTIAIAVNYSLHRYIYPDREAENKSVHWDCRFCIFFFIPFATKKGEISLCLSYILKVCSHVLFMHKIDIFHYFFFSCRTIYFLFKICSDFYDLLSVCFNFSSNLIFNA